MLASGLNTVPIYIIKKKKKKNPNKEDFKKCIIGQI